MPKKLLTRLKEEIRRRNYSYSTEKNYARWVVRYIRFHNTTHPNKLKEIDVIAFLTYLANEANVAASTQNQALSAIIFLYKNILETPLERLKNFKRARRSKHLPVVLSEKEALTIIEYIEGVENLIISLLYGSGLRISEALRLRILDIDFGLNQIIVRSGKGLKDRVTMLPELVKDSLKNQILKVKNLHNMDLEKGFGNTILPKALSRKYPNAAQELKWQYQFPSKVRRVDPRSGVRHRYHISPRTVRRALRKALSKVSVQKHVTPHTFRHSFATHPVRNWTAMKFYYVYVLQSVKDMNWYTGYTNNLEKRFKEHQSGKNLSTKHRRPFRLIYFEGCLNEEDAKAREKYLKSGMGKRYIKNRLKKYFNSSNF